MNWRSLPPNLKIPFLFKLNNYSIDCLKLLLYLSFSLLVTLWYLVTSSEIIKLMIAFLLSQDLGTGSTWAWGQMPFAPTYGVFNFDWRKSCEYQKMSLIKSITVKNLDHLWIVGELINEIGIVEVINQKLGVDNRKKITAGQVIKPTFRTSGM